MSSSSSSSSSSAFAAGINVGTVDRIYKIMRCLPKNDLTCAMLLQVYDAMRNADSLRRMSNQSAVISELQSLSAEQQALTIYALSHRCAIYEDVRDLNAREPTRPGEPDDDDDDDLTEIDSIDINVPEPVLPLVQQQPQPQPRQPPRRRPVQRGPKSALTRAINQGYRVSRRRRRSRLQRN